MSQLYSMLNISYYIFINSLLFFNELHNLKSRYPRLTVPHDACVDSLVLGVHPVDLVDMGVAIASTLEIYIYILYYFIIIQ